MIEVGVYGASGYMGGEVLRLLNEHPEVEIVWATTRSGKPIEYFHKNFFDSGLKLINPDKVNHCDVIFIALPTGQAMNMANEWIKKGTKIIDLGADFRLRNKEDWEQIYGKPHMSWDIV